MARHERRRDLGRRPIRHRRPVFDLTVRILVGRPRDPRGFVRDRARAHRRDDRRDRVDGAGPREVAVVRVDWVTGIPDEACCGIRRRVPRGIRAHLGDDLRGRETGARPGGAFLTEAERDDAGNVRGRHARSGDRLVLVARPGREDAYARSGDRVGGVGAAFGGEVAEAGRRIVVLEIAIAAAWRSEAAR